MGSGLVATPLFAYCYNEEKERKEHYSKHYHSYPVNTIEGNPVFQNAVSKFKIFNSKHFIATLIIGTAIP